jgi:GLPGLI family protein
MKKILLPVCMAFSLITAAQHTDGKAAIVAPATLKEGKVVYERVIQMQISIQGMDESVARQLPRTRTDNFELQFGNNKSLWKGLPNVQEEANTFNSGGTTLSSGGSTIMIRGVSMGSDDVTYTDFETGKRVDQRELDSKNYLVDDDIQKLSWKLTDDTKTILGYVVRKAVAQQYTTRSIMSMENGEMKRQQLPDTVSVVAWFTLQVPVPAGPVFQGQLPGLILELEMNKGRTVYKAVEVSPKVNVAGIKEPKGGKRITAAEYNKERDKVMEEMRKNMPANGSFRIRTGS